MTTSDIIDQASKKARRTPCHFKVFAIGFDRSGDYLGTATNAPRFSKLGGGVHAEMRLLKRYGPRICTMIIGRSTAGGRLRSMKVCAACKRVLDAKKIKVTTIGD